MPWFIWFDQFWRVGQISFKKFQFIFWRDEVKKNCFWNYLNFKKDTDSLNKIFGILLDFIFSWNPEIRRTQFLIYYFRRLLLTYLGLTLDKSSYSVFTHGTHFVAYLLSQVHLKISIVKCNFFQMLHFTPIKNLKRWMRQNISSNCFCH